MKRIPWYLFLTTGLLVIVWQFYQDSQEIQREEQRRKGRLG